jgi:hypothetical protein
MRLFRRQKKTAEPYLEAGAALTHQIATSLNLVIWKDNSFLYTAEEVEAIEGHISSFQKMADQEAGGSAKFHSDIIPDLQRVLSAQALAELAGSWKYADELTLNWKNCVSSYLKAYAAHLDPMVLLDLGELLVKAGYRSEAKQVFRAVLLFPTYAETFYGGPADPELLDKIVSSAKESLRDLG